MNLVFQYPVWWIILCVIAGGVYAFALYYKHKFANLLSKKLRYALLAIRWFVVAFLFFLLLSPLLISYKRKIEKPIVIIAQDASESLLLTKDSNRFTQNYPQQIEQLAQTLSNDFEVVRYTFDDKFRLTSTFDSLKFKGKQTNIQQIFSQVTARYANRNLGAVVLATDGLYNTGGNAVYSAKNIKAPVFTIGLGDTAIRKDLTIANLRTNDIVFLNNKFPIEVAVSANRLTNESYMASIVKNGEILRQKRIKIDVSQQFNTIKFLITTKEVGTQIYQCRLTRLDGEITYSNNQKTFFVNVIDSRRKILILTHAPHPDAGALHRTIVGKKNYQANIAYINQWDGNLKDYSLIVWNQIPSNNPKDASLIAQANQFEIPQLYIVGSATDINALNNLNIGIKITGHRNNFDDVLPKLNSEFTLFNLPENFNQSISNWPPVESPYGNYQTSPAWQILFYRQIGSVATQSPLLAFNLTSTPKKGIVMGEGFWKWRLFNFKNNNSFSAFDNLFSNCIQLLSLKEDRQLFSIDHPQTFLENEPVILTAEVYNKTYQLDNSNDVRLKITNPNGKNFDYTFSKTGNAYKLNAGILPVGIYIYTAKTKSGTKILSLSGSFSVLPVQIEGENLIANHTLLSNMAKVTGGKFFTQSQINKLAGAIKDGNSIKPISHAEKKLTPLIDYKWIFFMLLLLLSFEWFSRKRAGFY